MEHEVGIHMVVNPQERKNRVEMVGELFRKDPSFLRWKEI